MQPNFNYTYFIETFPEYANINQSTLEMFWVDVDTYATPIISKLVTSKQSTYYYYAEAHFAELFVRGPGSVGIVEGSTQGTVTISTVVDKSNSIIFWNQTSWGQRIAQLIKMRGGFRIIQNNQCCNNELGVGYDQL